MIADSVRPDDHEALQVGTTVHGFTIEAMLGRGGFGITYLVRDILGQRFALKECFPQQFAYRRGTDVVARNPDDVEALTDCRRRFLDEASALVRLGHVQDSESHIVRILTLFEANGTAYSLMEYLAGESLERRFASAPKGLPAAELIALLRGLLQGLRVVHDAGLTHRDIKPTNVLLRESGRPVLIDFGSARMIQREDETTYTQIFSPGYAPIEQILGTEQGPFSDIYAVGVIGYQAIGGAIVRAVPRHNAALAGKPDPLPAARKFGAGRYPDPLLVMIDAALVLQPSGRPASADEMLAILDGARTFSFATSNDTTLISPRIAAKTPPAAARRMPFLRWLATGTAAIALLVPAVIFLPPGQPLLRLLTHSGSVDDAIRPAIAPPSQQSSIGAPAATPAADTPAIRPPLPPDPPARAEAPLAAPAATAAMAPSAEPPQPLDPPRVEQQPSVGDPAAATPAAITPAVQPPQPPPVPARVEAPAGAPVATAAAAPTTEPQPSSPPRAEQQPPISAPAATPAADTPAVQLPPLPDPPPRAEAPLAAPAATAAISPTAEPQQPLDPLRTEQQPPIGAPATPSATAPALQPPQPSTPPAPVETPVGVPAGTAAAQQAFSPPPADQQPAPSPAAAPTTIDPALQSPQPFNPPPPAEAASRIDTPVATAAVAPAAEPQWEAFMARTEQLAPVSAPAASPAVQPTLPSDPPPRAAAPLAAPVAAAAIAPTAEPPQLLDPPRTEQQPPVTAPPATPAAITPAVQPPQPSTLPARGEAPVGAPAATAAAAPTALPQLPLDPPPAEQQPASGPAATPAATAEPQWEAYMARTEQLAPVSVPAATPAAIAPAVPPPPQPDPLARAEAPPPVAAPAPAPAALPAEAPRQASPPASTEPPPASAPAAISVAAAPATPPVQPRIVLRALQQVEIRFRNPRTGQERPPVVLPAGATHPISEDLHGWWLIVQAPERLEIQVDGRSLPAPTPRQRARREFALDPDGLLAGSAFRSAPDDPSPARAQPPAPPASNAAAARCRAISARAQIGEPLSPADLALLRNGCRG